MFKNKSPTTILYQLTTIIVVFVFVILVFFIRENKEVSQNIVEVKIDYVEKAVSKEKFLEAEKMANKTSRANAYFTKSLEDGILTKREYYNLERLSKSENRNVFW